MTSTKSEREALLQAVKDAQIAFWDALRELEAAYEGDSGRDAEIDHGDFDGIDIDTLDEEMRDAGFRVVDNIAPGEETK